MKIYLIIAIVLFQTAILTAQTTNKGKVKGVVSFKSSNLPVEYATIALFDTDKKQVIYTAATDSLGKFSMEKIPLGNYMIEIDYISCDHYKSQPFSLTETGLSKIFGSIKLSDSSVALTQVVVEGRKSTYIQNIDKKIFNVGTDLTSSSGSVSELIQNIPSVQVDVDGNVSLRGNENVQILINGKPSTMLKSSRATVLQQLPANSIERVEIITNPSAQFKPDGTSGIINLVLKKDRKAGTKGNLIANVGNDERYNGSLSLAVNSGKLNLNGNYGIRRDNRYRYMMNNQMSTDTKGNIVSSLNQNTQSSTPSLSHIAGLGAQWNINDKNKINGSINYTHMKFTRNEDVFTNQMSKQVKQNYNRNRVNKETQQQLEAAAAYTHEFAKNHTITADYTHSTQKEDERNNYTNQYNTPPLPESKDNTHIRQTNYENLLRVVYEAEQENGQKLVLGYELEADKSDLRYLAENLIDQKWIINESMTNDFIFNEQVHSLYSTYKWKWGEFDLQTGLRAEQSFIKSRLITKDSIVPNNYFMIYPTLHSTYLINYQQELQLSYSLRVNRPEGDDMNPFPEYRDPYNFSAGNPKLMPEKIHSVETGYQWKKDAVTLITSVFYHNTFDKITTITKDMGNNILFTTKENISSEQSAGLELITNVSLGKIATFNLNSNLYYSRIDATNLGFSGNKSEVNWNVALNTNINVFKNALIQLNSRYVSSQLTPQGQRNATFITNLGARYELRKYNLSFLATVSDLFNTFKYVNVIDTQHFYQRIERKRNPRTFYVGISYNFGSTSKKHKTAELKYDEGI